MLFAVDGAARVVAWPEPAARAASLARRSALGRNCWFIVHGERGKPPAQCRCCALLRSDRSGVSDETSSCGVIPLPSAAGGALISPRAWKQPASGSRREDPLDLSALGAVVATLSVDDIVGSVLRALGALRWIAGADDAEVFLVEPLRKDLLMAACLGPDRDVLLERARFAPGSGYPGMVIAGGHAVVTRDVAADRRYLRGGAKRRGLHGYVCVPLPGADGPVGSLNLAWRSAQAPIEHGLALLERAAPLIAATLSAGLSARRDSVKRAIEAAGATLPERAHALIVELSSAARARAATLVLEDSIKHTTLLVTSTHPDMACCQRQLDGAQMCSYLVRGRSKVLADPRPSWPRQCQRLPLSVTAPCCMPLLESGGIRGTLVLDYGSSPPSPPTRDLVLLSNMMEEGGGQLRHLMDATVGSLHKARPELELRCFGGFEARLGGKVISREAFKRKKSISLLQLLVLRSGSPIDRSTLAERLWPGVDEQSGANRLHGVVHALRAAIEPRGAKSWRYVQSDADRYWFNVDSPHRIDLYRFRKLLADAALAEREARPEAVIARLEEAVQSYQGDLFADSTDEDLFVAERAELRERCLDAHKRLAVLLRDAVELDRASHWLRRALEVDALREDLHQLLIDCLIRSGRRREAVDQYRTCVSTLQQELGASPLPGTLRLGRVLNLFGGG